MEKPTLIAVLVLPLVKAKRLFVEVAEKVKRFNIHIRPFDGTFQKRPEVFQPVRVDMPLGIALRVINHLMRKFILQALIGKQFIGIGIPCLAIPSLIRSAKRFMSFFR
jgi:hypothetical protein